MYLHARECMNIFSAPSRYGLFTAAGPLSKKNTCATASASTTTCSTCVLFLGEIFSGVCFVWFKILGILLFIVPQLRITTYGHITI